MITVKSCFFGNLLQTLGMAALMATATLSGASPGPGGGTGAAPKEADVVEVLQLKARAQNGETKAQVALGDFFGSRQQFAEAVVWYRYAATNGEVTAQLALAGCLIAGKGTTENRKEAAYWMRLAADGVERTGVKVVSASPGTSDANAGVFLDRSKNLFTNAHSHSTHERRSDTLAGTEPSLQERSVSIEPHVGPK